MRIGDFLFHCKCHVDRVPQTWDKPLEVCSSALHVAEGILCWIYGMAGDGGHVCHARASVTENLRYLRLANFLKGVYDETNCLVGFI